MYVHIQSARSHTNRVYVHIQKECTFTYKKSVRSHTKRVYVHIQQSVRSHTKRVYVHIQTECTFTYRLYVHIQAECTFTYKRLEYCRYGVKSKTINQSINHIQKPMLFNSIRRIICGPLLIKYTTCTNTKLRSWLCTYFHFLYH